MPTLPSRHHHVIATISALAILTFAIPLVAHAQIGGNTLLIMMYLKQKLSLSDAQTKKIRPIVDRTIKQFESDKKTTKDPAALRRLAVSRMDVAAREIRRLLTASQARTFDALQKELRRRGASGAAAY